MALIKCPECGNDVSDKAVKCPKCGYPLKPNNEKFKMVNISTFRHHKKFLVVASSLIVIIGLIVVLASLAMKNHIDVKELSIDKWKFVDDEGFGFEHYEGTITSNEKKMFIAVIGENEGAQISPQLVLMEDGKGTLEASLYKEDPASLYYPIGYISGEKVNKSDFSNIKYNDTDYFDYDNETVCYIDVDVEMKNKTDGFLWVEMSNDMDDNIIRNIKIPIVDGQGSCMQYLNGLPLKSRGVKAEIIPKYFCKSVKLNENDYEITTQFSVEQNISDDYVSYTGKEELSLKEYKNGIVIYTTELHNGPVSYRGLQRQYQYVDNRSCSLSTYLNISDDEDLDDDFAYFMPDYDIQVVGYIGWKEI